MWTGTITLVFSVTASRARSTFMHQVSSSMSTKTGSAPQYLTALAVATQLISGTITSSPGPTPRPRSVRCRAPVQLDVVRAKRVPT